MKDDIALVGRKIEMLETIADEDGRGIKSAGRSRRR